MVIIIMGVSGCGKTTIGKQLAVKLGLPFYDADEFHPVENIEKMKSGEALTDADRHPWLALLSWEIEKWNQADGAVLACSALKKTYRAILNPEESNQIKFVYLKGSDKLILSRMQERDGHYMPSELLRSQFDALEEPEDAITVTIEKSPDEIVERIVKELEIM